MNFDPPSKWCLNSEHMHQPTNKAKGGGGEAAAPNKIVIDLMPLH